MPAPILAILKGAFGIARTILWPLIYPFLKEAFENYVKDAEHAAKLDDAVFTGIQAKTAKEKLDASLKYYKAFKR